MSIRSAMICVVATKKRPAIIQEALQAQQVPHNMCWTTDYKLPEGWKPLDKYGSLVQNQVGAMRCWRGHQDALKHFLEQPAHVDSALILEDDAWPNTPLWSTICALAMSHLEEFEAISIHGRSFHHEGFDSRPFDLTGRLADIKLLVPKSKEPDMTWVQGSLAYLIRRDAAQRWVDDSYNGYPSDLYLCNRFKFALVDPTPFNHNRKHGSLIDCPTPKD